MSRTGRLLEIMITLNTTNRFTVNELAVQFSVSRRTMLRDLQLLSEMGVPLSATPGPHGGYTVMRSQQLPPIMLSPIEAVALILSYEAFEQYPDGPFAKENLATLTKLRSILPPEVVQEVDHYRERIAVESPPRDYKTPFIREILQASINRVHVEIEYDSRSGLSSRVIFPYGLVATNGFWYCPSYCYTREEDAYFRADRILNVKRREDFVEPAPNDMSVQRLLKKEPKQLRNRLPFRVYLTKTGCKLADSLPVIGHMITINDDGTGIIDTTIVENDISWYGRFLLGIGKEVRVEEPQAMIEFVRNEIKNMEKMYEQS